MNIIIKNQNKTKSDFNNWFDSSCLPNILTKAKTLDKKECFEIYKYFLQYRPLIIFEFGVQYGCSTRFFLELSNHLNLNVVLHSFDIKNNVKYAEFKQFFMHIQDITEHVDSVFKELPKPDLVFLDAHPYQLTKNIMKKCLKNQINFMTHDVSQEIGKIRASKRTNQFTNFSPSTGAEWELYTICELISQDLWTSTSYHNDKIDVKIITGKYGLAICQHKSQLK